MWQARVYLILARALGVMLCWVVMMGLPVLVFRKPLHPQDLTPFLGLFYATLLIMGTLLGRLMGRPALLVMAFPFMLVFTALGLHAVMDPGSATFDRVGAPGFFAIHVVLLVAWLLSRRPATA